MSTIIDLLVSKVYIVPTLTGVTNPDRVPTPSLGKIRYIQDVKSLQQYQATGESTYGWVNMIPAGTEYVVFADTFSSLANGTHLGQMAVVADEEALYAWISKDGTAQWVQCGGKTTLEPVTELPTGEEAGQLAIKKVERSGGSSSVYVLYVFDGSAWQSTQELITIDYVYNPMGDFKEGDSLENYTNAELWKKLLQQEKSPTVTNPSLSSFTVKDGTTNVSGKYYETGSEITTINIAATFSLGSIQNTWGSNAYQTQTYCGGGTEEAPITFDYTGASVSDVNKTGVTTSSVSDSQSISKYIVVDGSNTWKCKVSYPKGTVEPVTNFNKDAGDVCASGTTSESSVSFTGVFPPYATTVAIGTMTKQTCVANKSALTYLMVAEADTANRWSVEWPKSWGTPKTAYISGSNSGPWNTASMIGANNAATSISDKYWSKSEIKKDVNNNYKKVDDDNDTSVAYYKWTLSSTGLPTQGKNYLRLTF